MNNLAMKEAKALESALQPIHQRFHTVVIKREFDSFGFELVIQNQVAGVMFECMPREGDGWIVIIARLKDGVFPKHPVFITPESRLERFDIRDVAALRGGLIPPLKEKISNDLPISAKDVVDLLDACCADILTGDFRVFQELEPIVKTRALSQKERS